MMVESSNNTNCSHLNCTTTSSVNYDTVQIFSTPAVYISLILNGMVLLIGLVTNTITCISMFTRRPIRQSVHIYTFNLALCDLVLLSFYIPTQMVFIKDQLDWKMGLDICRLVNVILPVTLSCTVGTMLAIAFDRARGLLRPFEWHSHASVAMTKVTLPIIWLVSVLINMPLLIYPRVEKVGAQEVCMEGWDDYKQGEYFWIAMFVLTYAIPLIILIIAYALMFCYMKKHKRVVNRSQNAKVIRMGTSLLFVYAICNGFQHFFFFITSSFSIVRLSMENLSVLFIVANFFVSVQACVNPFLYGDITAKNIRKISRAVRPVPSLSMYTTSGPCTEDTSLYLGGNYPNHDDDDDTSKEDELYLSNYSIDSDSRCTRKNSESAIWAKNVKRKKISKVSRKITFADTEGRRYDSLWEINNNLSHLEVNVVHSVQDDIIETFNFNIDQKMLNEFFQCCSERETIL